MRAYVGKHFNAIFVSTCSTLRDQSKSRVLKLTGHPTWEVASQRGWKIVPVEIKEVNDALGAPALTLDRG